MTGPAKEHFAAISSHFNLFCSLLNESSNFDVFFYCFLKWPYSLLILFFSFEVKLHFLFLFADAIVAGVVDRWLQKTESKYTERIMGQEFGLNWKLIGVNNQLISIEQQTLTGAFTNSPFGILRRIIKVTYC